MDVSEGLSGSSLKGRYKERGAIKKVFENRVRCLHFSEQLRG
jgi:hypothetical protein